tara:strand:- start:170 stop:391 length:222 start_codon:yes stop_codon:yes gene_type:complete
MSKLTQEIVKGLNDDFYYSDHFQIQTTLGSHTFLIDFKNEIIYLEDDIDPERVKIKIPFTIKALNKFIQAITY